MLIEHENGKWPKFMNGYFCTLQCVLAQIYLLFVAFLPEISHKYQKQPETKRFKSVRFELEKLIESGLTCTTSAAFSIF